MSKALNYLAKNLELALSVRNMTQKELCSKIGIDPSQLGRWIHGRNTPGIDQIEKIADALGVSTSSLLTDPESAEDRISPQVELAEEVEDLTEGQARAVLAIVRNLLKANDEARKKLAEQKRRDRA
jgi:transcriptional regulator with XRE-family HTH domain